ncbi:MAG: D-glycerate dehydrogenase [candidate division Zixibacteria bacterium]|nr:D-glycerate dehydrogenase [candidate division Zixibacteria bacterium]
MMKPNVYITRLIPDEGLKLILASCDVEIWLQNKAIPRDVLLDKVRGLDGLVSLLSDRIDAEVMDAAGSQLKVISNYAVGIDNIDIAAANERGIVVGNTPDVLTETTADLAFALMMAAARRLVEGADFVKADKWMSWGPKLLLGLDIHHTTLGIIGMGRIGRAMARRAQGFDMNILYFDAQTQPLEISGARRVNELDNLLIESDYVSLHLPLTPETFHLIDAEALKKMKRTAILINTARGQVIDADALYGALRDGEIAYAALDVTDPEPMRSNHRLLKLPNCIVVPHIGSTSVTTRSRMSEMAAENLLAGLRGQAPPHPVNPEALNNRKNK